MKYFLIGTTLLVSILLIVVVVAQESKQPGMGSAIGGGAEAVAGGKTRGKDAVLSKFTVVFGIIFAVPRTWEIYEYFLIDERRLA